MTTEAAASDVLAVYPRSWTYRIIASIILAMVAPASWTATNEGSGVAAIGLLLLLSFAVFVLCQARERLVITQDAIKLVRFGEVWSVRWRDLAAVQLVLHVNDIGKVTLRRVSGRPVSFDMNWRHRPQLERFIYDLAQRFPAGPPPLTSPFRLGYALGRFIQRIFKKAWQQS